MDRIPFSEDELKVTGEYPGPFPGMPPLPKYNTPITPAENYELIIKGERPFWLPGMNDINMVMGGFLPDNEARMKGGKDFFGLEWVFVPVANGATRKPGAPYITDMNTWKDKITFPDLDQYEWESLRKDINPDDDRVTHATILNGIFERLISFMDFDRAAMALIDEDRNDVWFAAASGEGAETVIGVRIGRGQGIAGWVATQGEAVIVPDVTADDRFYPDMDQQSGFTTRSIMCVPLQTKGHSIGALEVMNKKSGPFKRFNAIGTWARPRPGGSVRPP